MQTLHLPLAHARQRSRIVAHEIDIHPDWIDFGPDDPLEAERWINPCARCGAAPSLVFEQAAHVVRCACGAAGNPGKLAAIAAVNWNKAPVSHHPSYRELPFFDLAPLDIVEARAKLVRIREYLVEQKHRCEQRVRLREPVGHRYFQRMRAYLAWSIYALGLVKEAELAITAKSTGPSATGAQVAPPPG